MTPTNPLSDRLQRGAIKLGALWRSNRRCVTRGWAILESEYIESPFVINPCDCEKKTDFCTARLLWLSLAADNKQEIVPGEHGLALTMTPKQWDATGMTITLPVAEGVQVKVGPKGSMSMAQFHELSKDPAAAAGIFALIKAFPKARIDGILAAGVGFPVNEKGEYVL